MISDNVRNSTGRPNLSVFTIRLTDVSYKSLNEAIAESKRGSSKGNGFIEFQANGNEATISFDGSNTKIHNFTMVDAQRDLGPTGQLEAIVQLPSLTNDEAKGNHGVMQSIGAITKRLNISATTRDTFEMTKQKAKQADEEMRKNSAKILKGPAGGIMSKKNIWDKISKARASTSQRPMTPLSQRPQASVNPISRTPIAGNGNIRVSPAAIRPIAAVTPINEKKKIITEKIR